MSVRKRPRRKNGAEVLPMLSSRLRPGCCNPYPDATFHNQIMVKLYAHHNGPDCNGYMEPLSVEEWNAEIDARAAARSAAGGNAR